MTLLQENVRWVEVNNVGGWPAMSKTLRDYDEEKVKDCKEDVDTLLVFVSLTNHYHPKYSNGQS